LSNIFDIISAVQIIPHFFKEKRFNLFFSPRDGELFAMFWAHTEIWHYTAVYLFQNGARIGAI